jgi:hypothetical protein
LLRRRKDPRRCRRASRRGRDRRGRQRSSSRGPRRRRERARRWFGFASWRERRRRLSLRSRLWARRSRLERMLACGSANVKLGRGGRQSEEGSASRQAKQDESSADSSNKQHLAHEPGPPGKGKPPTPTTEVGKPFALAQDDQSELAVGQPADAYHELHAAESLAVGVGCALVQLCQSEFVVQSPLLCPPRHGPVPPIDVGRFLPLVALKLAC